MKRLIVVAGLVLLVIGTGHHFLIHKYIGKYPVNISYEEARLFDPDNRLVCFSDSVAKYDYVIIDSMGELAPYRSLFSPGCKERNYPEIDFDRKTLLGKFIEVKGCSVDFRKTVFRDDKERQYTYTIDVLERGSCEERFTSMNWILIPRRPIYYGVTFEVKVRSL